MISHHGRVGGVIFTSGSVQHILNAEIRLRQQLRGSVRYDYLSILLEGGVPKFDEDQKTYVNLADLKKDEDKTSSTQEDSPKEETKTSTPKSETDETLDQIVSGNNVQIEGVDDDLPF